MSVARVKKFFFDRSVVINATDAKTRRVLSKFGAYTRTKAKSSLRYRNRPSQAGQPPSVHRNQHFSRRTKGGKLRQASPLKELTFFSYEPEKKTVVIGPAATASVGIVPPIVEYGGQVAARTNPRRRIRRLGGSGEVRIGGRHSTTTKKNRDGKWVTYGKLSTQKLVARANQLNQELYGPATFAARKQEARPWMVPAFEATKPQLPAMWAGN